jgi:predicted nucleic acid-binding protein
VHDVAVVNASPLILLSRCGHLELLRAARASLKVPAPVLDELRAKGSEDETVKAVHAARWLEKIDAPAIPSAVAAWSLGAGEAAVIAAALELAGSVALLDDRAARRAAEALGVAVVGTAGLILRAKRRGVLTACRPVLEELKACGMYLSDQTLAELLRRAGE